MANFEQYPDYAMMTNARGERVTKPWVSGPSPLSMALLKGGLGILAQPDRIRWGEKGGGGWDPSYVAAGGLLGLEEFGRGHENLRDQRTNFFTQRRAEENQAITNFKAQQEFEDRKQKEKLFPSMIEELKALNNPTITAKLPALIAMGQGNINTGYSTAANLLSAATGKNWGAPELIDGSFFQKEIGGPGYKYLHTPSKTSDTSKLSAPEITGELFNSSANLKDWNLGGQQGEMPGGLSVFKYNSMYREKMRIDKDKIKVTNKLGESKEIIKTNLIEGILDPTAYAIMKGMDTAKIKALGIDKPLIDTKEYTSEAKRTITEAKDIGKVGIIAQVENSLEKQTFDPTKISLQQYGQYFTGGALPLPGPARSYENMALAGSRMFGYLFSGATVKDDENRAMRMVLYPMPGDTPSDVARKLQFRQTVLELYKTYIPPDIGKKLFKKIIADADNNQITTPEEIAEIVISDNSTSQPIPELNSLQSEETLNNMWPE